MNILLMSSHPPLRRIVSNRLMELGHNVYETGKVYDAMRKLDENPQIKIAFISNDAHDGDPTCLSKFISAYMPNIKMILLLADKDPDFIINSNLRKKDKTLYAPFSKDKIASVISNASK